MSEKGVFFPVFYILIKDVAILKLIKRVFHIPNQIITEENGYFRLKTRHSRAISNIIGVFSAKDCKFKGMKSLYFTLWEKAFNYKKTNALVKLVRISNLIHKLLAK